MTLASTHSIKVKASITVQLLALLLSLSLTACKTDKTENQKFAEASVFPPSHSELEQIRTNKDGNFKAHKSDSPVQIDGNDKDAIWSKTDWNDMNHVWMGPKVDATDYQGKFKLAWDSQYLHILVEVTDDYLNPTLSDGVDNYWKGDYVEVFIDEDQSGGDHKFNHQAFAYHVSTEGHAIDKNTKEATVFFDDHVNVARSQDGNTYLWEMAIKLFDKQFDENTTDNTPVTISTGKQIGFSIAYGDNDGNHTRENFMGSKKTHGVNNDEGYVNADVFGGILFVD
jgi:hypothetical protein